MPDRPYIIRIDATVEDRKTGERIGAVEWDGFRRHWVARRPTSSPSGRSEHRTRREAADALWAEHERRRAGSLARRKG